METNEETRKTRRETIQLLNAFLKLNSRTNKCRYGDALVKKTVVGVCGAGEMKRVKENKMNVETVKSSSRTSAVSKSGSLSAFRPRPHLAHVATASTETETMKQCCKEN